MSNNTRKSVAGTEFKSYLLERAPRTLLDDATAKAKQENTTLKAVILQLLDRWTYPDGVSHRDNDNGATDTTRQTYRTGGRF